jgi:hypothetical protein
MEELPGSMLLFHILQIKLFGKYKYFDHIVNYEECRLLEDYAVWVL